MIADYYIIRKRKINIKLLYQDNGVYNYKNGFSVVGMISLCAGAILSGIFLNYSWLVGFPATVVIYTLLKKAGLEKEFEAQERASSSEPDLA